MLKIYPALVHKDNGSYWIEFPDLEGCNTFGESLEQTFENAQEALGLYLATLWETDQDLPVPTDLSDIKTSEPSDITSYVSVDVEDYNTCYEFVHFYFNMFLCILLSMILIYLFFIIKKPIFEIIIMIINIVYFFISIALIKDKKNEVGQDLKEYNIVGNTYITKIFHSFLGCYNFGLVIGFLLFNFTGTKNRLNKLIYDCEYFTFKLFLITDNSLNLLKLAFLISSIFI